MNVSANQRWVLLTSLKAATSYQFRVSAVNTVGEGPASDPTDALTLPQEGKKPNSVTTCIKITKRITMFQVT